MGARTVIIDKYLVCYLLLFLLSGNEAPSYLTLDVSADQLHDIKKLHTVSQRLEAKYVRQR